MKIYSLFIAFGIMQGAALLAFQAPPPPECPCEEDWKGPGDYFPGQSECAHGPELDPDCMAFLEEQLPSCQEQLAEMLQPPHNWTQEQLDHYCTAQILQQACMESNGGQPVTVGEEEVNCNCFECGLHGSCEQKMERYAARCHAPQDGACTRHNATLASVTRGWGMEALGLVCVYTPESDGGVTHVDPGCALSDVVAVGCLTSSCTEKPGTYWELPGSTLVCGPEEPDFDIP